MSTFTEFHRKEALIYSESASALLKEDYWYVNYLFYYYLGDLGTNRYVLVHRGFLTDGTTIPAWLTWLVPKHGRHSQAVVLHDWLCEHYYYLEDVVTEDGVITVKVPVTRREIDHIFYEALEVLNVGKWRRFVIRVGVSGYRTIVRPTKPSVEKKKLEQERLLMDSLAA